MRVYLDTCILADWFFVRTVKPKTRKKLKPQVLASHRLIEDTLRGRFNDSFVTSIWALLEAVGVLKRSRIEFNLFRDNVSLSYYSRLKDEKGFRLEEPDAQELHEQLDLLIRRANRNKKLEKSSNFMPTRDSPSKRQRMAERGYVRTGERTHGYNTRDVYYVGLKQ